MNTASFTMLCPHQNCLSLCSYKNIKCLTVGIIRLGHSCSVCCINVYRWVTAHCCCMSDILFHDRGTRRGLVVSSTPRPHFTPGKDPVPILYEAGLAPGPVWTGGKSRPYRDSIPDRPVRSAIAIPTELPGLRYEINHNIS